MSYFIPDNQNPYEQQFSDNSLLTKIQEMSKQNQLLMNPSIPAYQNPFNQINQKYTQNQFQNQNQVQNQNQNQNSFAPMQMYQNFKQNGQVPTGDGTVMTGKPTVGGK